MYTGAGPSRKHADYGFSVANKKERFAECVTIDLVPKPVKESPRTTPSFIADPEHEKEVPKTSSSRIALALSLDFSIMSFSLMATRYIFVQESWKVTFGIKQGQLLLALDNLTSPIQFRAFRDSHLAPGTTIHFKNIPFNIRSSGDQAHPKWVFRLDVETQPESRCILEGSLTSQELARLFIDKEGQPCKISAMFDIMINDLVIVDVGDVNGYRYFDSSLKKKILIKRHLQKYLHKEIGEHLFYAEINHAG